MAKIELADLWKAGTSGTSGTSSNGKVHSRTRTLAREKHLPVEEVPEVPHVPSPAPETPSPAPSAQWPKDQEPIPADTLGDPYWQWLTGATLANDGVRLPRCLDCRHCQPNEYSPDLGWCTCALDCHRDHGWPAARRSCRRFQAKDGSHG
jgi:hypothetical protein